MDIPTWSSRLEADGPLLVSAARVAGWDAAVPGTDWDVRTLVTHTGAVHRWATDAIIRSLATNETGGSRAFHGNASDYDRLAWFAEGHAALVAALRAAPEDLEVFTFLAAPSPLHFWNRRQAHETAIHRADVEAAAGLPVTPVPADFAQDGLAELAGWCRGRAFAADRPGLLALAATDGPSWRVTFGGERNVMEPGDGAADATVTGTSEQLYRWGWNRPADVAVTGDPGVAALWRRVRIT